jgi:zinc protease
VVLEDQVQLARLYVAWPSSKMLTEEDAALDVLAAVLSDGKGSRLHKRLVYDDQIAQDVSAFQYGLESAGSFWIVATAKPGVSLERVSEALQEELARIPAEGVAADERERALNLIETDFVRSLERVGGFGGKADRLNRYHFFAGTPGWVRSDLARYPRVTDEELVWVARSRLVGRPAVWLSVVPEGRADLAASGGRPPG